MAGIETKPNPNYSHYMQANPTGYNVGAGTANVHFRYWIHRETAASNGSFVLTGGKFFRARVNGVATAAYLNFDWRQYDDRTMLEGDVAVTGMTGARNVPFDLYFEGHSASFPAAFAEGTLTIPWVPAAPTALPIDQVSSTSFRFRFNGNSNGGSPITSWQAQIATNSAFTQNVQTVTSSGTTVFTGRTPGVGYYVRARGLNAIGSGPWSGIQSVVLPAGSKVRVGGVWLDAVPWVKVGGTWKRARTWVKDGGVWK